MEILADSERTECVQADLDLANLELNIIHNALCETWGLFLSNGGVGARGLGLRLFHDERLFELELNRLGHEQDGLVPELVPRDLRKYLGI